MQVKKTAAVRFSSYANDIHERVMETVRGNLPVGRNTYSD